MSTEAFHEANQVNLKIQSLGLEHNQLQRERQELQPLPPAKTTPARLPIIHED